MFYYIILFIKGFFIGVGKVIPGVSGAIIAISLGVYEDAIKAIGSFFRNIKHNFKFLLCLGLGVLISVSMISNLIKFSLNKAYLMTMLFFIGLILGGTTNIIKKTLKEELNYKNILVLIITFIILVILSSKTNGDHLVIKNNFISYVIMFSLGIIEAATMVIPGISGTAIMMVIGAYEIIIELLSNITNVNYIISNINIILPYICGIGLGIFIFVKLIEFLFCNYKIKTYYGIIGFTLGSVLLLFLQTTKQNYNLFDVIISLILLVIGYKMANLIDNIKTDSDEGNVL